MTEQLLDMQTSARGVFFSLQSQHADGSPYFQGIPGERGYATAQPIKDHGPVQSVMLFDSNGHIKLFFFAEKRPCTQTLKGPLMQISVGEECKKTGQKKALLIHPADLSHEATEVFAVIIKTIGTPTGADTCIKTKQVTYELAPVAVRGSECVY